MAGKGTPEMYPPPKKLYHGTRMGMGKPLVIMSATPRSAVNKARVVMKEGTSNFTRMTPVNTPRPKPTPIVAAMARGTLRPPSIRRATTHAQRATADPTLRSISLAMMTMVMPKAMIPSMETARRILRKLSTLRKLGAETARPIQMTKRTMSIMDRVNH